MITGSQDRASRHIDSKNHKTSDAQCPGNAQLLNHSLDGKRHCQATDARSCRGDAVCEAAPLAEPLRDNGEARDIDEATAHTNEEALRQEELPDLICERGRDESTGQADDAGGEGELDVKVAAGLGSDGCHEHGHGEVEAADEGVVKGCSAREDIIVDVVGEEDTVRLHWGVRPAVVQRIWLVCLQR
jgi:hypothetical protein